MAAFDSKVALVIGASSGIGAATTRMLLRSGARVAAVARRGDRLTPLTDGITGAKERFLPIVADILGGGAEDAIGATVNWAGGLNILINNAGLSRGAPVEKAQLAEFELMLNTNVLALANIARLSIPHLKKTRGDIVNIGSIAARALPAGSAMYSATKAAVAAFSEGLRRELAEDGVRVSVIHPGFVATEFFDAIQDPERRARTDAAMKSVGALDASDVSDLIEFILTRPAGVNIGDVAIRPTKQPV
jgi:NADP-dependent 3-hydroxy acid dehydrogenase YdfG